MVGALNRKVTRSLLNAGAEAGVETGPCVGLSTRPGGSFLWFSTPVPQQQQPPVRLMATPTGAALWNRVQCEAGNSRLGVLSVNRVTQLSYNRTRPWRSY